MKIVVDENIPRMTVGALRDAGHQVFDFRGSPDEGMSDSEVWRKAQQEQALLVTTDKGFAEHRTDSHFGILIIRLAQPNRLKIHERVIHALTNFDEEEWLGQTVVIKDKVQTIFKES